MINKVKELAEIALRVSKVLKLKKRKFNIGSAGFNSDVSWYATDIDVLDITKSRDWAKLLLFFKLDNIMAEHVWEHLNDNDTLLANQNCFNYLKPGGRLRLAVPDGFNPSAEYLQHVKPGGSGPGAHDHKILYNYKIMTQRLEAAGFEVKLLEYWDENRNFHFTDWNDDGGRIRRSRRYDPRNQNGALVYTSLIVDAIKPNAK
jgi:predicted SAM-dependent methyltransferase